MRIAVVVIVLVASVSAGYDIGVSAILEPDTLSYGLFFWVRPRVHNYGTESVSAIPVGLWLDSSGVRVEDFRRTYNDPLLPNGDWERWLSPEWPHYNRWLYCYIDMTLFTFLASDEDRSNDTMRLRFWYSSALLGDTILAHDYCHVFEVDGIINRDEYVWHNDISDFAGRAGQRRPRTSVFVHSGYGERVWFGVDVPPLTDRQDGDKVMFYADEDGDWAWEEDSSEGLYTVEVRNGIDSVFFTPMPGGSPRSCSGAVAASSVSSGNLQFEIGYPFNGSHWWYSTGAVSFWRGDSCWGWWPQSLDTVDWRNPQYYGVINWPTMGVAEDAADRLPIPGGIPTIVRGALRLPEASGVMRGASCVLLDIAGRRVMDLVSGENDVRHLAPGVYFIRPAGTVPAGQGTVPIRAKVVIQR